MSYKVGERLRELIGFEFSRPLTPLVQEELTIKLSGEFLEPLSAAIESSERKEEVEDGEDKFEDKDGIMKMLQDFFQSPNMTKEFYQRNLQCNAVLPYITTTHTSDWEKRDLPLVASFGFPRKVPNNLMYRWRSRRLLQFIKTRIEQAFEGRVVDEIEYNDNKKVPFLLFSVNDVTVILRIAMKPFACPQFLSKDVVASYEKHDNRFIQIATYFHNYLKSKVRTKSEQRKQKSVIPKLCSIEMMVIHCFKHYGVLPSDNIEDLMANLTVSPSTQTVSLGALYFLFLDYYLDVVNLETDFIEITTGDVVEKRSIGLTNKNILSISDIFDDHIPGERVNDILIFKRILKASYVIIHKFLNNRTGDLLNDLRVIPLRPRIEL